MGTIIDLDALAARVAGEIEGARVCLIVSTTDGRRGVAPADGGAEGLAAWQRLRMLGEVERGFLSVDGSTWAVVNREGRVALAIAGPTAVPGAVLDRLGEALRALEQPPEVVSVVAGDGAGDPDEDAPEFGSDHGRTAARNGGGGWEVDSVALVREFGLLWSDGERREGS